MSLRKWFAVAAIGRDRPGIVADLSECAFECGCNLEDASMTMLGSEFATLMLLSAPERDVHARLSEAFRRLEWERHLTIFLRPLDTAPAPTPAADSVPYRLVVEGVDKAGIVARLSRCLADSSIHILDLRSRTTPGPGTGTPVYTLEIRMRLPATLAENPAPLEERIRSIAAELHVDATLEPE
jgi:glycine cleavage system transcriptional repressor